jgi:hypothetical protein
MSAYPGIAIRPDGRLLLPHSSTEIEKALAKEHRLQIFEALRLEQRTTAGFYTCLPSALLDELRAAPWIVLDLETTGFTRYCAPARITGSTHIGPGTWTTYRAANPGASLSV